ncbi:MAG: type II toxin-antitoxin system RelE/ParE family toxin [Nitrospirae bacterium]|nr:type II toxin-antitoxin system RelE/ParE family toxin [Nitrospirota bacterium]
MAYIVRFRDVALADLEELPRNLQARILRAVEARLATAPHRYGVRLRRALSGLWKLRVGDRRMVYELERSSVTVWAVRHRKDVYPEVERRARTGETRRN